MTDIVTPVNAAWIGHALPCARHPKTDLYDACIIGCIVQQAQLAAARNEAPRTTWRYIANATGLGRSAIYERVSLLTMAGILRRISEHVLTIGDELGSPPRRTGQSATADAGQSATADTQLTTPKEVKNSHSKGRGRGEDPLHPAGYESRHRARMERAGWFGWLDAGGPDGGRAFDPDAVPYRERGRALQVAEWALRALDGRATVGEVRAYVAKAAAAFLETADLSRLGSPWAVFASAPAAGLERQAAKPRKTSDEERAEARARALRKAGDDAARRLDEAAKRAAEEGVDQAEEALRLLKHLRSGGVI